jgi:hypothetical protein
MPTPPGNTSLPGRQINKLGLPVTIVTGARQHAAWFALALTEAPRFARK